MAPCFQPTNEVHTHVHVCSSEHDNGQTDGRTEKKRQTHTQNAFCVCVCLLHTYLWLSRTVAKFNSHQYSRYVKEPNLCKRIMLEIYIIKFLDFPAASSSDITFLERLLHHSTHTSSSTIQRQCHLSSADHRQSQHTPFASNHIEKTFPDDNEVHRIKGVIE